MSPVPQDILAALEEIENTEDDAKSREIEMRFVLQTDNKATEDEVFGNADGEIK